MLRPHFALIENDRHHAPPFANRSKYTIHATTSAPAKNAAPTCQLIARRLLNSTHEAMNPTAIAIPQRRIFTRRLSRIAAAAGAPQAPGQTPRPFFRVGGVSARGRGTRRQTRAAAAAPASVLRAARAPVFGSRRRRATRARARGRARVV